MSTFAALSLERIQAGLRTRRFGRRLVYRETLSSTMDLAAEEARAGAPEGTAIVAGRQTKGRGRFQRAWVSPPGENIYLSLVLRPALGHLPRLGIVAALAVVRAVERQPGLRATIKWPNDVELHGRKLAGILIDSTLRPGGVDYAIAGIGLNVNLDPSQHPEIATIATSLAQAAGRPLDPAPVLQALLEEFEALYERPDLPGLLPEYRQRLNTLGKRVRVTWPGDRADKSLDEQGVAEDVDEDGALVLRRDDGSLVKLPAGEVSLRG